ncbi:MAG: sporulation inhibitor of replication protein SirA [Bacilli bacterium]|nr:sporulation inhibitor of replication protein SirA [Bacilli bacterium]
MRTFYLFELKDNILRNYKNNYEELYSMLESIHFLKTEDIVLGYTLFDKLVNPLKKSGLNDYIKERYLGNENYICYDNAHTINDFYYNESTKMIINNSHIRIKSNKNLPSFFFDMKGNANMFVCDFDNQDYFLLKETMSNSCVSLI